MVGTLLFGRALVLFLVKCMLGRAYYVDRVVINFSIGVGLITLDLPYIFTSAFLNIGTVFNDSKLKRQSKRS